MENELKNTERELLARLISNSLGQLESSEISTIATIMAKLNIDVDNVLKTEMEELTTKLPF